MFNKPKIALALGGGGARGLAHIGVLKVLEREGIPVDLIVGSSSGALVGAAYAVHPDAAAVEQRVAEVFGPGGQTYIGYKKLERLHRNDGFKSTLLHRMIRILEKEMFLGYAVFKNALLAEADLRGCVEEFVSDRDIGETRIPLAVVAVDLVSGKEVALTQGSLVRAVMAGCAVPGFMPSIQWGGMQLVDGAIVHAVPAVPAKETGAKMVIGVDVGSCPCRAPPIEDGIDVIQRAVEIMQFHLSRHCLAQADVLITPAVKQVEWTDFASYAQLIAEGEKAAAAKLSEIRDTLDRRRGRQFFRKTVYSLRTKLNRYRKDAPWANEKPATLPGTRGSERCW